MNILIFIIESAYISTYNGHTDYTILLKGGPNERFHDKYKESIKPT